MNKPTCEQCRYYLNIGGGKGFCGNLRISKTVQASAHSCERYEPPRQKNDKRGNGK